MKTVKTAELTGAALDWVVANIEEYVPLAEFIELEKLPETDYFWKYRYSTNWAQGGPIIERENISITGTDFEWWDCDSGWYAHIEDCYVSGPTPLIAAMRCYVASKLGADVEIPQELTGA